MVAITLQGISSLTSNNVQSIEEKENGAPPVLKLPPGRLYFGYPVVAKKKPEERESRFTGQGQTLRNKKK